MGDSRFHGSTCCLADNVGCVEDEDLLLQGGVIDDGVACDVLLVKHVMLVIVAFSSQRLGPNCD